MGFLVSVVYYKNCFSLPQLDNDADTSDIKVLVSVPPLCPPEDWRRLAEVFFEDSGIGGLYLANKSVLAMYGGGRTTGICVDTGEDMTYIGKSIF